MYAVLAYALSVVDMAIVLGPTTPRRWHPLVFRWFQDLDLGMRFQAAAGAALQLGIVALAIAAGALEAWWPGSPGHGWSMAGAAAVAARPLGRMGGA